MKFDLAENGLQTVFLPYQEYVWDCLWERGETGTPSRIAYEHVQRSDDRKSRASIIFFLDKMIDKGLVIYEEESGKGGYHKVYYPKYPTREALCKELARRFYTAIEKELLAPKTEPVEDKDNV